MEVRRKKRREREERERGRERKKERETSATQRKRDRHKNISCCFPIRPSCSFRHLTSLHVLFLLVDLLIMV